jgi:hypothetical protein
MFLICITRVNICRKFNGKYMRSILYFGVMVGLEQLEIVNVKQVRIQTECAPSTVFSIFGCCWSVRIFLVLQQYFSYIMATSFSGGGSRREPPKMGK